MAAVSTVLIIFGMQNEFRRVSTLVLDRKRCRSKGQNITTTTSTMGPIKDNVEGEPEATPWLCKIVSELFGFSHNVTTVWDHHRDVCSISGKVLDCPQRFSHGIKVCVFSHSCLL